MALRLQSLSLLACLRSRRAHLFSQTVSCTPSSSPDGHSFSENKRLMSGASSSRAAAAAWEESVELETDHSLARRVEQAINEYRVRKAAPDWLPFLPGSSYWIPPENQSATENGDGVSGVKLKLSEEELLALFMPSGWPSPSISEKDSSVEKKKKTKSKKKT